MNRRTHAVVSEATAPYLPLLWDLQDLWCCLRTHNPCLPLLREPQDLW